MFKFLVTKNTTRELGSRVVVCLCLGDLVAKDAGPRVDVRWDLDPQVVQPVG